MGDKILNLYDSISEEIVTEPNCLVLLAKELDLALLLRHCALRCMSKISESEKAPLVIMLNFSVQIEQFVIESLSKDQSFGHSTCSFSRETTSKRSKSYSKGILY